MGGRTLSSILLDTSALLWLLASPEKVSPPALDVLADPANDLLVSAASAWEIAIKTRLGRLDGGSLLTAWPDTLRGLGAEDLAITSADAVVAGALDWVHRDPFDRVIIAQALRRGLTVATSDQVVLDGALTAVLDTRRR